MSDVVVKVKNLGKLYRIGGVQSGNKSIVEGLLDVFYSPIRKLKQLGQPTPDDRNFWALRNVSFEVRQGEVIGIIGRNGAGKSTILKILSRITTPTEGVIKITGRVGSLLEVGTGFHPELTGRENIYLNGVIIGMKRKEISRKFDEIVSFAGVEKFLDTPVKRYSSGMYVRLAFAVAAHLEPEILIVDEVLAVGDIDFQQKCLGKMDEVAHQGRTVFFVSHNMPSVKKLCSRAILLENGTIKTEGDTESVITEYYNYKIHMEDNGIIPDSIPRIGTGEALIRRVVLKNNQNEPIHQLFFGQKLVISLDLEVNQEINDLVIELGISTLDGLRIASVNNIDEERDCTVVTMGRVQITIELDVVLLPRDYVIDVGIMHLSGLTIDWIDHVYKFTALNIPETGDVHYRWGQVRGFTRPKSLWSPPSSL